LEEEKKYEGNLLKSSMNGTKLKGENALDAY
jgi:hypothetical protein